MNKRGDWPSLSRPQPPVRSPHLLHRRRNGTIYTTGLQNTFRTFYNPRSFAPLSLCGLFMLPIAQGIIAYSHRVCVCKRTLARHGAPMRKEVKWERTKWAWPNRTREKGNGRKREKNGFSSEIDLGKAKRMNVRSFPGRGRH